MKNQTLKFLGRGSMFNIKEGSNSAYWKDYSNTTMILIDCGCTTFQRIESLNILDGVKELVILITHSHSDHIGSLSDLLFYCKFVKPNINVQVLSHSMTMPAIKMYLDSTGTLDAIRNSNIHLRIIPYEASVLSDEHKLCNITFVPDKSHSLTVDESIIYGCGIILEFPDKVIYYSGDTQRIPYKSLMGLHFDEIYVDCAVRTNSPGSTSKYPHYTLYDMYNDMRYNSFDLSCIYAMHLDCDGVINECKQFGIKIVEVEGGQYCYEY